MTREEFAKLVNFPVKSLPLNPSVSWQEIYDNSCKEENCLQFNIAGHFPTLHTEGCRNTNLGFAEEIKRLFEK